MVHQLGVAQLQLLDDLEGVADGQNERIDGVLAAPLSATGSLSACSLCIWAGSSD